MSKYLFQNRINYPDLIYSMKVFILYLFIRDYYLFIREKFIERLDQNIIYIYLFKKIKFKIDNDTNFRI